MQPRISFQICVQIVVLLACFPAGKTQGNWRHLKERAKSKIMVVTNPPTHSSTISTTVKPALSSTVSDKATNTIFKITDQSKTFSSTLSESPAASTEITTVAITTNTLAKVTSPVTTVQPAHISTTVSEKSESKITDQPKTFSSTVSEPLPLTTEVLTTTAASPTTNTREQVVPLFTYVHPPDISSTVSQKPESTSFRITDQPKTFSSTVSEPFPLTTEVLTTTASAITTSTSGKLIPRVTDVQLVDIYSTVSEKPKRTSFTITDHPKTSSSSVGELTHLTTELSTTIPATRTTNAWEKVMPLVATTVQRPDMSPTISKKPENNTTAQPIVLASTINISSTITTTEIPRKTTSTSEKLIPLVTTVQPVNISSTVLDKSQNTDQPKIFSSTVSEPAAVTTEVPTSTVAHITTNTLEKSIPLVTTIQPGDISLTVSQKPESANFTTTDQPKTFSFTVSEPLAVTTELLTTTDSAITTTISEKLMPSVTEVQPVNISSIVLEKPKSIIFGTTDQPKTFSTTDWELPAATTEVLTTTAASLTTNIRENVKPMVNDVQPARTTSSTVSTKSETTAFNTTERPKIYSSTVSEPFGLATEIATPTDATTTTYMYTPETLIPQVPTVLLANTTSTESHKSKSTTFKITAQPQKLSSTSSESSAVATEVPTTPKAVGGTTSETLMDLINTVQPAYVSPTVSVKSESRISKITNHPKILTTAASVTTHTSKKLIPLVTDHSTTTLPKFSPFAQAISTSKIPSVNLAGKTTTRNSFVPLSTSTVSPYTMRPEFTLREVPTRRPTRHPFPNIPFAQKISTRTPLTTSYSTTKSTKASTANYNIASKKPSINLAGNTVTTRNSFIPLMLSTTPYTKRPEFTFREVPTKQPTKHPFPNIPYAQKISTRTPLTTSYSINSPGQKSPSIPLPRLTTSHPLLGNPHRQVPTVSSTATLNSNKPKATPPSTTKAHELTRMTTQKMVYGKTPAAIALTRTTKETTLNPTHNLATLRSATTTSPNQITKFESNSVVSHKSSTISTSNRTYQPNSSTDNENEIISTTQKIAKFALKPDRSNHTARYNRLILFMTMKNIPKSAPKYTHLDYPTGKRNTIRPKQIRKRTN